MRSHAFLTQIVRPPTHFDEDENVAVEGDNVDFTASNVKIPSDNGVAQTLEVGCGSVLAGPSLGHLRVHGDNHIMLLSLILSASLPLQNLKSVETKVLTVQKGKVIPGTLGMSPDLNHVYYSTPDQRVVVDGFTFGPFASCSSVVYSGDSAHFGFTAVLKPKDDSIRVIDGRTVAGEYPVASVFRAGDSGPLCWVEHDKEKDLYRMVTPDETTGWEQKIERIVFADDGQNFFLRTSEKAKVDASAQQSQITAAGGEPPSKEFVVYKGGKRVARERLMQVYAAPNKAGFAALSSDQEMIYKGTRVRIRGEVYGKPVFSSDGSQFAFRTRFTEPNGLVNQDRIQYTINGSVIAGLQIQSGLMFNEDGTRWAMCGLNSKKPFLYTSDGGMVPYGEVNGLGGAPPEPYKFGRFVNGKMVLFFQARLQKPLLFVEDKGLIEISTMQASSETISISPNGRYLAVACGDERQVHAFLVDLANPGQAVDLAKGTYELQVTGARTFVWSGPNELRFMVLRKNDINRVTVSL